MSSPAPHISGAANKWQAAHLAHKAAAKAAADKRDADQAAAKAERLKREAPKPSEQQ